MIKQAREKWKDVDESSLKHRTVAHSMNVAERSLRMFSTTSPDESMWIRNNNREDLLVVIVQQRRKIKWISLDELPTTRDVDEAMAFNPFASTGYWIVQFESLDFLRRLGLVGDIVAELLWPGNSLDTLRPSTDECTVRSSSFRLFDDRHVHDSQILVKTFME